MSAGLATSLSKPRQRRGEGNIQTMPRWCSPRGRDMLHGPPGPKSSGQGSECLQVPWDPKGGELHRSTTKPWETAVEVGSCSDVQIV